MASEFPGFPKEALTFLRNLKKNNRREWYQPRKELFEEHVKAPMVEMVGALNRRLARFAPDYITDPRKAIFRIYRDTRFSRDKSPYKTTIAAVFVHRGLAKGASAGLYFSVSPEEVEVAGGLYMPGPDELRTVRGYLAEHHQRFRKILAQRKLRGEMGGLWDEPYPRVPRGFPQDHPAADLLRYKGWGVYRILDPALATSPRLFNEVLRRFRLMLPLVEFLNEPLIALGRQMRLKRLLVT